MLDTWYTQLTTWYASKPWYIRLICIGLTVVIVVLFLVRFVSKRIFVDYQAMREVVPPPANPTGPNDEEEVTNAENTMAIKVKLIDQLKERKESQEVFEQQASVITGAKNMGELHDLRKKFNL